MFMESKWFFKFSVLVYSFFLIHSFSFAQNKNELMSFYEEYDTFVGIENSEINFGNIYNIKFRTHDDSHLFYKINDFTNGIVIYNNQSYQKQLKYDILNDLVVVKYLTTNNLYNVSLVSDRIQSFTISNDLFEKLDNNKEFIGIYGNGFFETVFKGKHFEFYIKHVKIYKSKTILNTISNKFEEDSIYFLKYKNSFYKFKNKKELIKILQDQKKEINSFFEKERNFSKETLFSYLSKADKQTQK
jgi:hypothetical protein